MSLCLHSGGKLISEKQLEEVTTPENTATWFPVPHHKLLNDARQILESSNVKIVKEELALNRDGAHFFGLLHLGLSGDGAQSQDWGLVAGIRNSHDQRFPASVAIGSDVFACDNLAFNSEVVLSRRHTKGIFRDFPRLLGNALGRLGEYRVQLDQRYEKYRETPVGTVADLDRLIMNSYRSKVIPSSQIGMVLDKWENPEENMQDQPANVWKLLNAYTAVMRDRVSPEELVQRSIRLHGLLDQHCGLLTGQAA
jgi:hypothetical protein